MYVPAGRHGWGSSFSIVLLSTCAQIFATAAFRPPPSGHSSSFGLFGHDCGGNNCPALGYAIDSFEKNDPQFKAPNYVGTVQLRGGSTKDAGTFAIFSILPTFWNRTIRTAVSKMRSIFPRKADKTEQELLNQLKTTLVRAVAVPNSTVLPPDVVRIAVKRSGLLGRPLQTTGVQELAKSLKLWYARNGYILHSVTGANLKADSATAEIIVDEPKVSRKPVEVITCKEMVVDEDGQLLSFRQYFEKHAARKTFRHDRLDRKMLNTTFVETDGRTRPTKIASAMSLLPGNPFQWNGERWDKIRSSGVFSKVLRAAPRRMDDGTVQLQVFATEPPPRHLEYGLGKSLYTGSWEGEVDFEHQNLFGGGEVVGLMVRRGTKDAEPSLRLRYSDEKFGLGGGFDLEIFNDFLGDPASSIDERNESENELFFRKGTTFRLRNPISTKIVENSVSSTSVERTSSRSGTHEDIASTTLTVGPFRTMLPFDARSSIVTTLTGGARLRKLDSGDSSIMPYASGSATARQILPLGMSRAPVITPILALQHTVASSTNHLPRHEAKAMGVSTQIRGCSPDGPVSSSIKGTAELRLPVELGKVTNGCLVLFGDWYCVQRNHGSSFSRKSSIGIGIRKLFQGLPLKYDICYTSDGKIKTMFGLGPDFEV